MMTGLNLGSGQRPFHSIPDVITWINVDKIERPDMPAPDIIADAANLSMIESESVDYAVLHHTLEHFQCNEADGLIREAHRVLKPGGSLLIFIPDIRALAIRWLEGGISDYIYIVNLMGAWMGNQEDIHRWHYTRDSLRQFLNDTAKWSAIQAFNWRKIPNGNFARDFWILAVEAVK